MKTSLKAGFAQSFSCCPKNLSGPYAYDKEHLNFINFLMSLN